MQKLQRHFKRWLEVEYSPQTFLRAHDLRLPGRRKPATVTLLAQPAKVGVLLILDLWKIVPGIVREVALAGLAWDLLSVQTYYQDLVESEERKGQMRTHSFLARANVVGRSIQKTPAVCCMADSGRALRVWTYERSPQCFQVRPYCDATSSTSGGADLAKLLSGIPETLNRRRSERRPVDVQVVVQVNSQTTLATLREVSLSGARLDSVCLANAAFPLSSVISIVLLDVDRPVLVPARLVRSLDGAPAIAVSFGDLSPRERDALERILAG